MVGVLVFVDEDVLEVVVIGVGYLGECVEEVDGLVDEVVEVECVGFL